MSWLEENIGEGYQQVVIGFSVFIIGALLGWMEAADSVMSASDVYMPAVVMLSGAMVTMLGLSFGTDNEDDRTDDLMNAIQELTDRMNAMLGSEEE
ncbi:MAG: aluminum activated malate transporter family protein [Candidatus Poseidoniaceae archaeon]|nr:aluminum activated malate transporter family protein [Candidatus Poseidoniaceae archaeon]